jgi:hypothetical protein
MALTSQKMNPQELIAFAQKGNTKALAAYGFRKAASFTTGGKPHFFYNPRERKWLVWSREKKAWFAYEQTPDGKMGDWKSYTKLS